jgi:polyferredoxin
MLTGALLTFVQVRMDPPGLLAERFAAGAGWIEALALAVYAGALARVLTDPGQYIKWRPRIWLLFSIVFFAQLALGLLGFEKFLMTGKLHFPIPALIVGGPAYRGEGFFMLILFGVTLLFVGPAWCSWLCYIGSWDEWAARLHGKPEPLPGWRKYARVVTLALVIIAALALRYSGAPTVVAIALASAFGIIGVGVMALWSGRTGAMAHCTAYCPIGFIATRFGKISPFRVKIDEGCDECGTCGTVCRYDALHMKDINKRKPGEACTLCGDCIGKCEDRHIEYRFPGLSPQTARKVFLVIVSSLHAVFLGVARI